MAIDYLPTMNRGNRFLHELKNGGTPLGMFVFSPDVAHTEALGLAGFHLKSAEEPDAGSDSTIRTADCFNRETPMRQALIHLLRAVTCACIFLIATAHAAGPYPTKPIRIILPAAAGGNLDITARIIGQKMAESLGQPVIVANIPNALTATRTAATSAADGYTLLAIANTFAIAPSVTLNPGYDPVKDFTGIGSMNRVPLLMVTAAASPDESLKDFVSRAKARPGALSFASGGMGTTTHLAAAMYFQQAGLQLLHVPYKGNAPAIPDVVSGQVNVIFDPINTSGPMVREGKFRALGFTSNRRSQLFPNVPTIAEQGLPGFNFAIYTGLVAPAGVPREIIAKLHDALSKAIASPELRERFSRDGTELSVGETPEQYTEFLREETLRYVKVVSDAGIKKE